MQKKRAFALTKRKVYFLLLLLVILLLLVFFLLPSLISPQRFFHSAPTPPVSTGFVTRLGNNLLLNGKMFRFTGTNIHWLGLVEEATDEPSYPSQTRIVNVFADAVKMRATVVRSITLGVSVGCANCLEPSLNTFNDRAFAPIDYSIKTAREDNIRLIIPLTDGNHYYEGNIGTFTDWRGLSNKQQFFSNQAVIRDFQTYIAHILNHVNQYTGIAYKDDPTIMLWEIGNEIPTAPDSWTEKIAEYIKSMAPHQLVGDGKQANSTRNLTVNQLQLPAVDVYTSHFYFSNDTDYITRAQTSANLAKEYNKVYFIGEYDWTASSGDPTDLASLLAIIENPQYNIAGDTFYQLYDNGYHGDRYTLHYPGDTPDMRTRIELLIQHAAKMLTTT